MPLSAGARLAPCEVVALLGVGGMGEKVYRARDTKLGRDVALDEGSASLKAPGQSAGRILVGPFDRAHMLDGGTEMTPDPNVLLRTEPCAECGGMMLWTQNAWAHADSRAAAYRCLNGHVLDPHTTHQCPRCGVHDTHPITAPEDGAFACNRCGNRFEIRK